MKRKQLLILATALLLALLVAIFFAKKFHYVDPKPAVALGGEYFSDLKQRQVGDAIAMYSDVFREKHGEEWQKLLGLLDQRYGAVTDFALSDARTAPMGEIPCVVVRYQVTRELLFSEEKLTVCPQADNAKMAIAGHEIVRLDTGRVAAAGLTVSEMNIVAVGAAKSSVEKRTPSTVTPVAVKNAADEFYNRMSAGQYDAIYDSSSVDFKASASRNEILLFLTKVNQRIGGSCTQSTLVKETVMPNESGDLMYLNYLRKCNNGEVRDGMSWKFSDGKALLASYHLNSPEERDLPLIHAENQNTSGNLAEMAIQAANTFYREIYAHQYDAVFGLLSDQLNAPDKREMITGMLKEVEKKAGSCNLPVLAETSYTTGTAGMFVEVSYNRDCTNRNISDHFTWKIVKGKALLDGYYVAGLGQ